VRVLVVDDEPHLQRFVLRTLQTAGHDGAAAGNAEEALDLLRRRRFDVVLCDLKMPGAGGQGLYRALLSEHAELAGHIIFCTGDTARPATQAFLNGSGAQCLLKPFTAQQLLDAIRNGTEPPREAGKDPSA
jgi:CheY-like chemotaxis protein